MSATERLNKINKQEVLATNDPTLCQWAGITEEEYNNGKLEE